MQFAYGTTRWVILLSTTAFKFARFAPFLSLRRFCYWLQRGKVGEKVKMVDPDPVKGVLKYLGFGVLTNLRESRISRDFPELPFAKTTLSLGFVNFQVRAGPLLPGDLDHLPFRDIARAHPEDTDWSAAKHYGRVNGVICLVDYGGIRVEQILHKHYPRVPAAQPA